MARCPDGPENYSLSIPFVLPRDSSAKDFFCFVDFFPEAA